MSAGETGHRAPASNDTSVIVAGDPPVGSAYGLELAPDPPPRAPHVEDGSARPADRPRRRRGFAAMDRTRVSEIARKGGKAAHTAGTAHEFTSDEAREAGRKGGRATHAKRRQRAEQTAAGSPSGSGEERGGR